MSASAVLFDLGGTLARYYARPEFPAILRSAIAEVRRYLPSGGLVCPAPSSLDARVKAENYEAADYAVRPLAGRLARIFDLSEPLGAELGDGVCRAFMQPIFALGAPYDDAIPTLSALRAHGLGIAIVSNTPWGSPGDLWREELARLDLSRWLDAAVFCADVGWRKPDARIFRRALALLGVGAPDAVFVGDDPRWDVAGPAPLGIQTILLQRAAILSPAGEQAAIASIATLCDLPPLLGLGAH